MSARTTLARLTGARSDGHRARPTLALRRMSPASAGVDRASLHALATLLLLAQLPHVFHLPIWTSLLGGAVVGARLWAARRPDLLWLDRLLSSVSLTLLAVGAALAIRLHYGYFIGRDPCVAFLFLLVAAKFAEFRRPADATFLMCLAAFLLLTQYFYSQTLLAALVTLPAVLALGNALMVLRDPARAAPLDERLRLTGKLLVQGAPVAAILFVAFPRLPGPLWSLPEDGQAITGLSDSMAPGSIGELSRSDEVAFRVEFDAEVPPPAERYWRGPVLDRFDGRRWSARPVRAGARPAAAEGDATLDYSVMLQPHGRRWLFALELPASLPRGSNAPGASARPLATMTEDGQLLAPDPVTRVIRYRASSSLSAALDPGREPAAHQVALAGRNPRTVELARELRARHADDADLANALLERFNVRPYRYTLRPALLGDAPVDEFLFDTLEGFCEHYASAFVVALRAAGVPARVVTGYLGGEMNGDYMIVRQSDAHAWAEAWIDGAWRRYDPTGAVAPSRVESGLAAALPESAEVPAMARLAPGWLRGARLRWDRVNHAWQRLVVDFDDDSQAELLERLGLSRPALWQIAGATLLALGLWCAWVLGDPLGRLRRRDRRVRRPEEIAWQRLERGLARRGLARGIAETPGAWLERVARADPKAAAAVAAHGGRDVRFARPAPGP